MNGAILIIAIMIAKNSDRAIGCDAKKKKNAKRAIAAKRRSDTKFFVSRTWPKKIILKNGIHEEINFLNFEKNFPKIVFNYYSGVFFFIFWGKPFFAFFSFVRRGPTGVAMLKFRVGFWGIRVGIHFSCVFPCRFWGMSHPLFNILLFL